MFINTTVGFLGVGQGLFVIGKTRLLPVDQQGRRVITWIYDCGSTSEGKIKAAIHSLQGPLHARSEIDFVVISHLDSDHIRGISELLKLFRIGKIFLPYQDLPQRLLWGIASLDEGITPQQFQRLVPLWTDPVAYIRNLADQADQTPEIVLVPSSEGRAPQVEPILRDTFTIDGGEPSMVTRGPGQAELDVTIDSNVRFLQEGTTVIWYGMWEFVPYVDPWYRDILLNLPADVRKKLDATVEQIIELSQVDDVTEDALWQLIQKLKKSLYVAISNSKAIQDRSTKVYAEDKNAISLMAYFGAVDPIREVALANVGKNFQDADTSSLPGFPFNIAVERGGILCTGDAALGDDRAVDQLVDYLSAKRIENIACYHVPHHGAKSNSSAYTGENTNAPINIFSADPKQRPYHPHRDAISHYRAWTPSKSGKPHQTICPLVNEGNFEADIWSAKSKYAARHLDLVVEANARGWELVDQEMRRIRKLWWWW
jgi:hypothetical protein